MTNDTVQPPYERAKVAPPSEDQRVEESPVHTGIALAEGQRDSPPLPQAVIDSMNDGIEDQRSRRAHREPAVRASSVVLVTLLGLVTVLVLVMAYAFYRALTPESVAKASAVELIKQVGESADRTAKAESAPAGRVVTPAATAVLVAPGLNTQKASAPVGRSDQVLPPIRIEAKIYGEVRDSMVPMVGLVSILTLAIVVVLGTLLKATFAEHPNGQGLRKNDEATALPLAEALKALAESIKAAFK